MRSKPLVASLLALSLALSAGSAWAKERYTLAISIYTGWMPWYYAAETGIVKKWADSRGIEIEVVPRDYVQSITEVGNGNADAVVITTMDALNLLASKGVDITIPIIGDYSNGNDVVAARGGIKDCAGLKGQTVYLAVESVSEYLLDRCLEQQGLSLKDITSANVSEVAVVSGFSNDKSQQAVVTWNPMALEIVSLPGVSNIYDSSKIPGEILDVLAIKTKVAKAHPQFVEALAGAWYETLSLMRERGPRASEALQWMARRSETTEASFRRQLTTTRMFWTPQETLEFAASADFAPGVTKVRDFLFKVGLFDQSIASADALGIELPDGKVLGKADNVKLRFDLKATEKAAKGELKP